MFLAFEVKMAEAYKQIVTVPHSTPRILAKRHDERGRNL